MIGGRPSGGILLLMLGATPLEGLSRTIRAVMRTEGDGHVHVSNTAEGSVVRPMNGAGDNEQSFSLYIWCDQHLIGAALGTESSRGGEWSLTTYDIDVGDEFNQPSFTPRVSMEQDNEPGISE